MQQWNVPSTPVLLERAGTQLHVNSQQLENIPLQLGLPLKRRLKYLICKYKEQEEKTPSWREAATG